MKTKFRGLVLGVALSAFAFTACETTSNTNVNVNRVNSNTAVVVNDNTNTVIATNTNTNRWANANSVTRADYDRDRANYERDRGTSTIGQGANDSWLWFKTRAALMTTDDLRESTINVDVENDVVTLRGTVANAAQKTRAVQVAKDIDEVKQVRDELKIAPADSMTNTNTNTNANR
jgi:hypothetical protein